MAGSRLGGRHGYPLRTDDPGYLALVERYFAQLGAQLSPLCGPAGPIVAVQVENELYDEPDHIATLKTMAQDAGITAPLWTATGWGGAQLPLSEVLPVYSGYSDGFSVDAEDAWDEYVPLALPSPTAGTTRASARTWPARPGPASPGRSTPTCRR